ncbi:MAG: hypothetical protein HYX48_01110 [Chlamydiales bacterium]|nr:hypothetical protein [Chlamydiales bacterium]
MFSVFLTVLGCFNAYEESAWSGVRINFGDQGLYYDPQKGSNWWGYYFNPVQFGEMENPVVASHRKIHRFHKTAFRRMSRERGYELIQKYIQLRPEISRKIEEYVEENFKGYHVIGVHFRGTDKKREAKRVSFDSVFNEIRLSIAKLPSDQYKLFVATDEQQFLDEISAEFKGRVLYIKARRSTDGKAVHFEKKNQYELGEQALVDSLLLSKTEFLVRTVSNLSFCSLYFNPTLPVVTVTEFR